MSGMKRALPELRSGVMGTQPSAYAITPDEMDRYEVNTITLSGAVALSIGTAAVAGTSAVGAVVLRSAIPDWPRNVEFALTGTATGMQGTAVLNGKDQFGSVISETYSFGSADNGGTVVGTKVFGQFTSGTVSFGTAVGNGTARFGFGTTGTTALIGLPYKLGGTTDVKIIGWIVGTGAVAVNGGTIAAFVDVPNSAIKSPFNIAIGSTTLNVWAKPTFNSENQGIVANLNQRV